MEVKSLFKREKKYETLLCLEVLHLVLQKSKPEARIKVMPLLENASLGLEDENNKGCDAKKSLKLATASQSGKAARPLCSWQTCSFYTWDFLCKNYLEKSHLREQYERKKIEEECISLSSISHRSRIILWNEISWVAGLCHPFSWQPLRKLL